MTEVVLLREAKALGPSFCLFQDIASALGVWHQMFFMLLAYNSLCLFFPLPPFKLCMNWLCCCWLCMELLLVTRTRWLGASGAVHRHVEGSLTA